MLKAAEEVRKAGYRWWDCCTPFPVHGLDDAMGIKPTILPVMVFFAGMTGTTAAFVLQAFTNAWDFSIWMMVWVTGYPYLISGKPLISLPAFIPVMFEVTILLAALTCVFGMFTMNRPAPAAPPAVQQRPVPPGDRRPLLRGHRGS